jgi:hypothetical protein
MREFFTTEFTEDTEISASTFPRRVEQPTSPN